MSTHCCCVLMTVYGFLPDVSSDVGLAAAASSRSGNVQKKMVPWQSLLMALPGHDDPVDLELNLNDHSSRSSSQSTASLVLVTSLIDRIPNLGGRDLHIVVS